MIQCHALISQVGQEGPGRAVRWGRDLSPLPCSRTLSPAPPPSHQLEKLSASKRVQVAFQVGGSIALRKQRFRLLGKIPTIGGSVNRNAFGFHLH